MGLTERLNEMRHQADAHHQSALANANEVTAREFTAEDGDRCIRVSVDGDGAVRSVRVNPRRFDAMDGDELGRRVIEAVRAARRASREGTRDVRERLSGGATDIPQWMRDDAGSGPPAGSVTDAQPPEPGSVDAMSPLIRRSSSSWAFRSVRWCPGNGH